MLTVFSSPAKSRLAPAEPFITTVLPKQLQDKPQVTALKSTTLLSRTLSSPYFTFKLVVRPTVTSNFPGLPKSEHRLDVSIVICNVLNKQSFDYKSQASIDFVDANNVPFTLRLGPIPISHARKNTPATIHHLIPTRCAAKVVTFASAKITITPCFALDYEISTLMIHESNQLIAMLDDPKFSDCLLLPSGTNAKPIHCSRVVLAKSSPFFHALFSSDGWSPGAQEPIKISWPAHILFPCLTYMYYGWLWRPHPAQMNKLMVDHKCEKTLDQFGHDEWGQVADLAHMLELPMAAWEAQCWAVKSMQEKQHQLVNTLDESLAKMSLAHAEVTKVESEE
ncbi:hypothetical protein BCR44DRAFT_1156381 [Catenaria anguillulae PL171]|uniref:BTB domain-containing protein n=1 Tax=Catenaria anguillulae PL171 TaxID=765915 RepID=A0A1Y2HKS3_9FUNG|nr:hypothetical protein BCR44DRAFT_1156381 [Catenaria anguillulae PL171]